MLDGEEFVVERKRRSKAPRRERPVPPTTAVASASDTKTAATVSPVIATGSAAEYPAADPLPPPTVATISASPTPPSPPAPIASTPVALRSAPPPPPSIPSPPTPAIVVTPPIALLRTQITRFVQRSTTTLSQLQQLMQHIAALEAAAASSSSPAFATPAPPVIAAAASSCSVSTPPPPSSSLAATPSASALHLHSLPDDVLCHVFDFLSTSQRLAALSRVCRAWSVVVTREPRAWHTLTLAGACAARVSGVDVVHRVSDGLWSEWLQRLHVSGAPGLTDRAMQYVWFRCHRLEVVRLERCAKYRVLILLLCMACISHPHLHALPLICRIGDGTIQSLCAAPCFARLTELSVMRCERITDHALLYCAQAITKAVQPLLKSLPPLTLASLNSRPSASTSVAASTSTFQLRPAPAAAPVALPLRVLELSGCEEITDVGISAVLYAAAGLSPPPPASAASDSKQPLRVAAFGCALQRLSLRHCSLVTDHTLRAISVCCPALTSLDLRACSLLNDAFPVTSAAAASASTTTLASASDSDAEGFALVASGCRALRTVWLASGLGNRSVLALSRFCAGSLTALHASHCVRLSDEAVSALRGCALLHVLDLRWCQEVSDAAVSAVVSGAAGRALRTLNLTQCKKVVVSLIPSFTTLHSLFDDLTWPLCLAGQ
jgi:hypothetical protein